MEEVWLEQLSTGFIFLLYILTLNLRKGDLINGDNIVFIPEIINLFLDCLWTTWLVLNEQPQAT